MEPKNRKKPLRLPGGFTLAELIVVIAILAILSAVGLLALQGYSSDAEGARAKANVRSVYSAIAAESALTGNSPRHYVVHDPAAALADGAVAYVDGSPVALTGGQHGTPGTNYSAGNPDWVKLKLNPDKFRLSHRPPMGGFLSLASVLPESFAAYDAARVSVGALDAALAPAANGRKRSATLLQAVGKAPATGVAAVAGNFPAPTAAQVSAGAVAGLVKDPASASNTRALVDGDSIGTSGADGGVQAGGDSVATCVIGSAAVFGTCSL